MSNLASLAVATSRQTICPVAIGGIHTAICHA
jgi:hypothetical protein